MDDTPKKCIAGGGGTRVSPAAITAEMVQEWFTDALRRQVGRGKDFGREDVCEGAGINPNTLGSWMSEKNVAHLWQFMRLSALLGPELVNQLLRPIGMGGMDWLVPDETGLFHVNAAAAEFGHEMAQALADDGRIDAAEQARIDVSLGRFVEVAQRYQSGRGRRFTVPPRLRLAGGGS